MPFKPLSVLASVLAVAQLSIAWARESDASSETASLRDSLASALDGTAEPERLERLGNAVLGLETLLQAEADLSSRIDHARTHRDVIVLTCLLDKQEQLDDVGSKMRSRAKALLAPTTGDDPSAHVVLAVYRQKVQDLVGRAEACESTEDDASIALPTPPGEQNAGEPHDVPIVGDANFDAPAWPAFKDVPAPAVASPIR